MQRAARRWRRWKLNGALAQNGGLFHGQQGRAVGDYLADESSDGVYELYRADAAGASRR